jgi:hypothetical protein
LAIDIYTVSIKFIDCFLTFVKCRKGAAKIEIFKDFLRHRDCIDPSCVVGAAAALGGSTFYSRKYFSFALKAIIGIKHN